MLILHFIILKNNLFYHLGKNNLILLGLIQKCVPKRSTNKWQKTENWTVNIPLNFITLY
jgi:hypothetical protein